MRKSPSAKVFLNGGHGSLAAFIALAGLGVILAAPLFVLHAANQDKALKIGMAKSFLNDKAKSVIDIASEDFKKVLTKTTGLAGDLTSSHGALEVAEKLAKNQLDVGIFHAHEFAWAQQKHKDLQPILVAVNKQHIERAYVIVHKKNPAKSIADLKGKKLDMPVGTSEVCRVYLGKLVAGGGGKTPMDFFASIGKSSAQVEALDGVAREKADVVVVDTVWLEFYKDVKGPTFTNNLRILQESDVFPPAVIAYRKNGLDEKRLNQFKAGLLKAHETPEGRDMMKEWNIDAFEAPPANYADQLKAIHKAYPTPTGK